MKAGSVHLMAAEAVIFDLDGLLIDSEPLWVAVECRIFAELGVPLTPEDCAKATGLRIDEWVAYWYRRRPWNSASASQVETMILDAMAETIATQAKPLPGAHHALDVARSIGVPLGIASSAPSQLIRVSLERLGVTDAFTAIVSAEHERRGKPDPGVYITAATQLDADPVCCVAIEDSPNGVRAARAAGMRCIAVPTEAHRTEVAALTDQVLGSLCDLTAADLHR